MSGKCITKKNKVINYYDMWFDISFYWENMRSPIIADCGENMEGESMGRYSDHNAEAQGI